MLCTPSAQLIVALPFETMRRLLALAFHMRRWLPLIGMCERGSSLPRIADLPPGGAGSGQRHVRPASPSSRGGLILLEDAGGNPAAVAQIDLVLGATDPGRGRLTRRSAVEIVVEDKGYLRRHCDRQAGNRLPALCRSPVPP
jgi:hypothetical protein